MQELPLEHEQVDLFKRLVEALRSRPRAERDEFMAFRTSGADQVQGNGLALRVLYSDVQILAEYGCGG